jgi:hypothetical protein
MVYDSMAAQPFIAPLRQVMKTTWSYWFKSLCAVLMTFCIGILYAQQQVPPLERRVTFSFSTEKAQRVLQEIESQAGVSFSYSAGLVPSDKIVSVNVTNRPVREALDKVFSGKVVYKTRNEHIILSKAPDQQKVITGYVENTKGDKVSGASVYDRNTMASATTDEYGYFEMKIRRTTPLKLEVNKLDYTDTIVPLQTGLPALQNIVIAERKDTTIQFIWDVMQSTADSLSDALEKSDTTLHFAIDVIHSSADSMADSMKEAGSWLKKQLIWNENVNNIRDSLHRPVQISFLPFLGTNGRLSGNVSNDYSWNILAGYNKGVQKAEIAGLLNVDRQDVCCFQLAGFGNIVGGNVSGAQIAGFGNINGGNTQGIQFAGFTNISAGKFIGSQFAGFANLTGDSVEGAQFAGFANINGGVVKGAQFSGFMNLASKGFQGGQFAGFINMAAKESRGIQMSGFMNVAGKLKGSQIGLFNFADTLSGVPVGLLSLVNKGYHKLEFSYDDMGYGHLSFRSGVNKFYNIISAGAYTDLNTDTVNWTFGYGIGTAPRLADWLHLNIDLTANQIVHGNVQSPLNQLAKIHAGLDFHLTKNISLFGAVVLNGYFYHDDARMFPGSENIKTVYSDRIDNHYSVDSWVGWRVGIRLF